MDADRDMGIDVYIFSTKNRIQGARDVNSNSDVIEAEEVLSDSVYYYDRRCAAFWKECFKY